MGFYDDKSNSTGALCARLAGETAKVQGVCIQYYLKIIVIVVRNW